MSFYKFNNSEFGSKSDWADFVSDLILRIWGEYEQESQDTDDIDRIYRQEETQALNAILDGIAAGTATWRDLSGFELDFLAEIDGMQEYLDEAVAGAQYAGLYEDINAANGDPDLLGSIFEEYGNAGIETNPYIQQDLASTGSATAVITGTVDNAILKDIIRKAAIGDGILGGEVDFENLPGYGGIWDGLIRHIKVIGKGLPLPIPDWLPLPGIFELPTIGKIFDTVTGPWKTAAEDALRDCVATGKSASQCMEEQSVLDILVDGIGNATEGIWEATTNKVNEIFGEEGIIDRCTENPSGCAQEVFDKIKDIFGEGAVDPTATGGNIPDWLKVIIIGGAYGDEILGELEDLFGGDIDGDDLIGTPEDPTVTPPVTPDFDCASVGREQVAGATTAEECGPLIAPYGYCEDGTTIKTDDLGTNCEEYAPNGFCEDGVTKKDNPEGTNCNEYEAPLSAEEQQCNEQGRVFNDITGECEETCANPEHVVGADGSCGPPEVVEECTDPNRNQNEDGSCAATCTDGSLAPESGLCPEPVTPGGEDGPPCDQPQPNGWEGISWAYKCGDTHCPADGSLISDHPNNDCSIPIGTVIPQEGDPCDSNGDGNLDGTITNGECVAGVVDTSACDSQNRVTNEDGSCGECLPGFTPDPQGFDQCIQAPPECNDCSCAEYAAANPIECTTCPDGESYCVSTGQCEPEGACPSDEEAEEGSEGGGGGGFGGSGGRSMFQPLNPVITASPQLLTRQDFPITDFLAGIFTNSTGGQNV